MQLKKNVNIQPNDATNEEDVVEEDDSDKDMTWNRDFIDYNIERLIRKRRRRSELDFFYEDYQTYLTMKK